jgi:hypothetical protein
MKLYKLILRYGYIDIYTDIWIFCFVVLFAQLVIKNRDARQALYH